MRPIFINGIGSVSSLGASKDEVLEGIKLGRSNVGEIDVAGRRCPIYRLSESAEAAVQNEAAKKESRRLDKVSLMAIAAARRALIDCGKIEIFCNKRVAILGASARGTTSTLEQSYSKFCKTGETSPFSSPTTTAGNIAAFVGRELLLDAIPISVSMTCASFSEALIVGASLLESDRVDIALIVGAEAPLTPFTISQFISLGIYTEETTGPFPSKPHQGNRIEDLTNSMCLGEGASAFVLSNARMSKKVYPCITGLGSCVDTTGSVTSMAKDGSGVETAIRSALIEAQIEQCDLVGIHAPATRLGDTSEILAIQSVFGSKLPRLFFNKHLMGHTFGASSAFTLEHVCYLMNEPVTIELPYCSYLSPAFGRSSRSESALSICAGFGGAIVAIALEDSGRAE